MRPYPAPPPALPRLPQVGMRIALSCVLLGPRDFLAAHGAGLVTVLCGFIGNVKDRGMLALLPVMDAVVQVGGMGGMGGMGWSVWEGEADCSGAVVEHQGVALTC